MDEQVEYGVLIWVGRGRFKPDSSVATLDSPAPVEVKASILFEGEDETRLSVCFKDWPNKRDRS